MAKFRFILRSNILNRELKLDTEKMIVSETNSKGVIMYANDDFCKLAGYTKEELIGSHHNMVRHRDMPSWAFQDLWATIQANKLWKGIVKNQTKNGDYYWVFATVYQITKKNGEIRYLSVRVKPTDLQIEASIKLYKIKG